MKPLSTHPASVPMVGPAGFPPSEFVAARRRLESASIDIAEQLRRDLLRAVELHDLTRLELKAAQRDVTRLSQNDLLPNPADYWATVAVPRASLLVDDAVRSISRAGTELSEQVDRFLTSVSRSTLEPWISSAYGLGMVQTAGEDAVGRLTNSVPGSDHINEVGEWWQRSLRRSAFTHSLPKLLISPEATDVVIGTTELALLDSSPWCYGDRLLSAFELAHSEINSRTRTVAEEIRSEIRARTEGSVVSSQPGGPVTIELRHSNRS